MESKVTLGVLINFASKIYILYYTLDILGYFTL